MHSNISANITTVTTFVLKVHVNRCDTNYWDKYIHIQNILESMWDRSTPNNTKKESNNSNGIVITNSKLTM